MSHKEKNILVKQGSLLFFSTLVVNLGNYLINLLLGRWMGPAAFADIGLLVTLMLMLSFIALAFQLTAARYTALYHSDEQDKLLPLLSWLRRIALYTGLIMAAGFILLSFYLQHFFKTSSLWLFPVFGAGMPLYLIMSTNRGILQGRERYGKLALTYQVEMWSRLILSIVAIKTGAGATGVAAAITLSLLASLLVSDSHLQLKDGYLPERSSLLRFLLLILVYECSQILINNSDTMLVKHFFPPDEAGLYAALALIGRIVYFGTWTVVTLLFPIVIRLEKEGKPHLLYFTGGLMVVAFLSGAIVIFSFFFPEWMVRTLFGPAYIPIAPLLWRYALATALFTCANVFVYYNISLERRLPVWITIAGGVLQIVLIWNWHSSFQQVISIQIWLMTVVIIVMLILQKKYAGSRLVRTALLLAIFCCPHFGHAQEALKPGFTMLESGQFREATLFFRNYLAADPSNRTALLCYGRATGLSGNVPEARQIFAGLEQQYPEDFEIGLNVAEACMWAKEYDAGRQKYARLVSRQPESFPANLGYANAFSALLQYDSALIYINKSLTIQPGNTNALLSLKYARLGLADQYEKKQQFSPAASLLEQNLSDFRDDKESLFAKGQLLIMQKEYIPAIHLFQTMIAGRQDIVNACLSVSYAYYLKKDKKAALKYADKAIAAADSGTYLKARLGRITALGWNEQFRQAFKELDSLENQYPNNPDISLKRAMLLAWGRNFGHSLTLFRSVLTQRPSSFDANLGTADILFAQELDEASREYVNATLKYYPGQKDAMDFMQRLALRHAPSIYTQDFRSSDKGGNVAWNYAAGFAFDIISPLRISLDYRSRDAKNNNDGTTARNDNYTVGVRWRIQPFWLMTAALNEAVLKGDTTRSHLLTDIATELKIAKWHILELRYRSDIQNFTAGLINSNISMDNFIATYNLSTPVRLGLYTQFYYTVYSDDNKRSLLFASLYYNILNDPVIKTGININSMHFTRQLPGKYFSPDKFGSYELFASIENLGLPGKKWLYQALFAGGSQKIDNAPAQAIYRYTMSLGYRPVNNFEASIYYLHSNSASSTVAGYTYTEAGLKVKWVLKKFYLKK